MRLYKNKLTLKLYQQIKILYHVHMIGGEERALSYINYSKQKKGNFCLILSKCCCTRLNWVCWFRICTQNCSRTSGFEVILCTQLLCFDTCEFDLESRGRHKFSLHECQDIDTSFICMWVKKMDIGLAYTSVKKVYTGLVYMRAK